MEFDLSQKENLSPEFKRKVQRLSGGIKRKADYKLAISEEKNYYRGFGKCD